MTPPVRITRTHHLPDRHRLERCARVPELGPRILFFSGGTALRGVSRKLIQYTHNSIHLITPFDSGGSSKHLREAFDMLAVGDLRNRLMALADQSLRGQPEIFRLFNFRLPRDRTQPELRDWLERLVDGEDPMVAAIADPMRKIIRTHLRVCREHLPPEMDLRGASIGNLILVGGFHNQGRHIDPVIYLFSRLVEVRGTVRPVTSEALHLVAELEDGTRLAGQHRFTGKEEAPIAQPIRQVFLSRHRDDPTPVTVSLRDKVRAYVLKAELICYPMGSFYSSLIANLLPRGVGQAIAESEAPRVYVPSTSPDPELVGRSLADCVGELLAYLRRSCLAPVEDHQLLQYVLVDPERGAYGAGSLEEIRRRGIEVVEVPLVTDESSPLIDDQRLVEVLVSMC
jgi:CofD-related protein of GAK system